MQRTILLVDDEENILNALKRVFRPDGYTVHTATSGAVGLDILARHGAGVVISDQRMPEMTGVEFLSRVKEQYPGTMRIVLSGYTELKSITDAINQGAVYKFLTKPWDDELLREHVKDAFTHYELRGENQRLTAELQKYASELEQRVEEKTRELRLHVHAFTVAHDVLEQLPLAVLGIDDAGLIVIANRAAHQMAGTAAGAMIGMPTDAVLPPPLREALRTLRKTESEIITIEFASGQPTEMWWHYLDEKTPARGRIVVLRPVTPER